MRLITRLPVEVTQNKDFSRPGKPVYLCEFCDGDALDLALRNYKAQEEEQE